MIDSNRLPGLLTTVRNWVFNRNDALSPMPDMKTILLFFFIALFIAVSATAEPAARSAEILSYLQNQSRPLTNAADLDPLLERIAAARIVLLGESSHGTSEYYVWRAAITRRLITEKNFTIIAVEGDWPSCYHINRYIKKLPDAPPTAAAALAAFQRWPRWMWANQELLALVNWLADYNNGQSAEQRVGFYGLDVYSLPESMDIVRDYAAAHSAELAEEITAAYRFLEPFRDDPVAYARYTRAQRNYADQTRSALAALTARAEQLRITDPKAFFHAQQNAYIVKRAEMHYRAMADPRLNAWNKRVEHMQATLDRLLAYHGPEAKIIVWAHNTHIGDARATAMAAAGQKNIGQLTRQTYGADAVVAVGFSTHRGQVLAGSSWGEPPEIMRVPPAQTGSVEYLFNRLKQHTVLVIFDEAVPTALQLPVGHRAKGVVYNPEAESGNYVPTILPARYDAFIFITQTSPLSALMPEL